MTEEEFIGIAEKYGIHVTGYSKDTSNNWCEKSLSLVDRVVGYITDVFVYGHPEMSGRAYRPIGSNSQKQLVLLSDMTKEWFKNNLLNTVTPAEVTSMMDIASKNLEDVKIFHNKLKSKYKHTRRPLPSRHESLAEDLCDNGDG